jgi:hypothetical protein
MATPRRASSSQVAGPTSELRRVEQVVRLTFERVWLDEGRVVAVRPKQPCPLFFQTRTEEPPQERCIKSGRDRTRTRDLGSPSQLPNLDEAVGEPGGDMLSKSRPRYEPATRRLNSIKAHPNPQKKERKPS